MAAVMATSMVRSHSSTTFDYQPIEQGRWLNWNDEKQRNNVCVIGNEFVRLLFPGRPAVGSRL